MYTTTLVAIGEFSDNFDDNHIYIGRPGKGQDGYFGNPVVKDKVCPVCGETHATSGSTLPCYTKYLNNRIKTDEKFRLAIIGLVNKTLVCFCKNKNHCHGSILVKTVHILNNNI